jgi:integrase
MIDRRALLDYKMKQFKSPSKVSTALSKEKLFSNHEINRMISMTGPRTSLIVEFLYRTACRRDELCGVMLRDCKEKRHHIHINIYGKGNKIRVIPIKKDLYNRIKNVFKGKKYLFEKKNGNQYDGKSIWAIVSEPSERLLNRHMSPHMLRHSRLTHLFEETGDLKACSVFAGHASIATFADIYQHTELNVKQILGGIGDQ